MVSRYIDNNALRYALYIVAFLPIFSFRDFTPDNELRYLSIADEALQNGSFITFFNHGLIYADKPPLYLWIVMLGKSIFGLSLHALPKYIFICSCLDGGLHHGQMGRKSTFGK